MKNLLIGLTLAALTATVSADVHTLTAESTASIVLVKKNGSYVTQSHTTSTKARLEDQGSGKIVKDTFANPEVEQRTDEDALKISFIGDIEDGNIIYTSISKDNSLKELETEMKKHGEAGSSFYNTVIEPLFDFALSSFDGVEVNDGVIVMKLQEEAKVDVKTKFFGTPYKFILSDKEHTKVSKKSIEFGAEMIKLAIEVQLAGAGKEMKNYRIEDYSAGKMTCRFKDDLQKAECKAVQKLKLVYSF